VDAIDYLFSLEALGIKLGLANITALCAALGHPERSFQSLIVAGTNGKGSVTAMAAAALHAAGHRTGRYTSPHLSRLEERFVIGATPIDTRSLREAAGAVRSAATRLGSDVSPTFFEATTAVAFELFRRGAVQIAVLEVGLGGRFDATNVVEPVAAAITSIDRDHEEQLGRDLAGIAFEKAGVIKPGSIVVMATQPPEAAVVIEEACRARGATLVSAAADTREAVAFSEGRATLTLSTPRRAYEALRVGLRGRHQVANAVCAVRLLEELDARGIAIPEAAIRSGIGIGDWPGRLELVELRGGAQVLLDAAHNPAGARALAAYLAEVHPAGVPIVFGVVRDKDAAAMLAALAPCASRLVLTRPASPRAREPQDLLDLARRAAATVPAEIVDEPWEAVARALDEAPLACVAGSIFLVGDIRARLLAEGARPLP
jgi:dihydrofolate synthase/folylpolyglutamate synthase